MKFPLSFPQVCSLPTVVTLAAGILSLGGSQTANGAPTNTGFATAPPALREVIVVFKTHFDIGYTDLATNIVQKYRTTMIDNALEVADQNRTLPPSRRFVWTLPGWPTHKILEPWPGQSPARSAAVQNALKEGRFVVHALPFTTHTELLEPEDLVRGLGYSSRIARSLGQPLPRDAKMTDVPEHTWMMATLLHHAGVTFMHIGCNGASGAPAVPPLYWWEGPDGSRVLTMYSPNYGTGLLPPADWPYHTWLALQHTGDNHGPPRPNEVKRALDELNAKMPAVKVRVGRLSDFGDAILAENPKLPVVHADTTDTWIHGPMSDPAGARLARNTRPLITATEALNTQLRGWGVPVKDAAEAVAAAYEQSLLYGEHTWGGSIGWLKGKYGFGDDFLRERAAGRFERIESSWDEHSSYIQEAQRIITPLLDENLRALAQSVAVSGRRVLVYNPLPWKRSGLVTVAWSGGAVGALEAAHNREIVPAAVLDEQNPKDPKAGTHQLRFIAQDLPPMGYSVYVPVESKTCSSDFKFVPGTATLESPLFKVVLDPAKGTVCSLVDKKTGRELVDTRSPVGFGQYLYERFDANQVSNYVHSYLKRLVWTVDFEKPGLPPAEKVPYRAASPQNFSLRFEETPVTLSAVMQSAAGNGVPTAVTTRLTLYREQPYVDLEVTVHDKPLDSWPEAGWLCLPFNIAKPQFRLGRLGSIIDPGNDIVPGANRNLFALNTGVALLGAGRAGAAFCPLDNPLVSLDTPGCWKFSTNFIPQKPVAFINLFNNQWNTNFRLWNGGTWTSRVRLWSLRARDADEALVTPSVEARYPLLAVAEEGRSGQAPASRKGLSFSRHGVLVSAFGDNPDGPGTLLRVWELAGKTGSCRIELPGHLNVATALPVNLRGEPAGKPVRVNKNAFTAKLHAFAPATYVLQAGERSR